MLTASLSSHPTEAGSLAAMGELQPYLSNKALIIFTVLIATWWKAIVLYIKGADEMNDKRGGK